MSRQPTIEFCALQIRGTSHLPLLPYRSPLPKPHGIFSPEKTLRDEGGDPLGALSPPLSSSGGYVEKSCFRKPWLRSRLVNLQTSFQGIFSQSGICMFLFIFGLMGVILLPVVLGWRNELDANWGCLWGIRLNHSGPSSPPGDASYKWVENEPEA